VMCPRCDWVLMCDNCDATMVVHRTRKKKGKGQGDLEARGAKEAVRGSLDKRGKKEVRHIGSRECAMPLLPDAMKLPELCPLCHARLTHLGRGRSGRRMNCCGSSRGCGCSGWIRIR